MTGGGADRARVVAAAAELWRGLQEPDLADARLGEPLPVEGPAGLDSWVVPLTRGAAVLGFLHLDRQLTLYRFARLGEAPPGTGAHDWFDRAAALRRARAAARSGDRLGEPVLTYHRSRDRLAWRVPVAGRPAVIWVAGSYAFEEPATAAGDG